MKYLKIFFLPSLFIFLAACSQPVELKPKNVEKNVANESKVDESDFDESDKDLVLTLSRALEEYREALILSEAKQVAYGDFIEIYYEMNTLYDKISKREEAFHASIQSVEMQVTKLGELLNNMDWSDEVYTQLETVKQGIVDLQNILQETVTEEEIPMAAEEEASMPEETSAAAEEEEASMPEETSAAAKEEASMPEEASAAAEEEEASMPDDEKQGSVNVEIQIVPNN